MASSWAGRVLIAISGKKESRPIEKTQDIKLEPGVSRYLEAPRKQWELRSEIYYGMSILNDPDDLKVIVRWAGGSSQTIQRESKNRLCEWYETLKPITIGLPNNSADDIADIFVYLCKRDEPLSYCRLKATDLLNLDPDA